MIKWTDESTLPGWRRSLGETPSLQVYVREQKGGWRAMFELRGDDDHDDGWAYLHEATFNAPDLDAAKAHATTELVALLDRLRAEVTGGEDR